jgi:hypothetical protein
LRAKTINKFMGPKESHMAKTQWSKESREKWGQKDTWAPGHEGSLKLWWRNWILFSVQWQDLGAFWVEW